MGELGHSEQTPAPRSLVQRPAGMAEDGLCQRGAKPRGPRSTCSGFPRGWGGGTGVRRGGAGGHDTHRPSPVSWPAGGRQQCGGAEGRCPGAFPGPAPPGREGARRRRAAGRSRPKRAVPREPSQLSAILSGDRRRVKNKIIKKIKIIIKKNI